MNSHLGFTQSHKTISVLSLLLASGCLNDHVVFTTSTKFAIEISQQADQPPKMLIGYKREEGVFLPSPHKPGTERSQPQIRNQPVDTSTDANTLSEEAKAKPVAGKPEVPGSPPIATIKTATVDRADTYSVISFFCVMANPSLWDFIRGLSPFSKNIPDGLQVHSFFATGVAAQHAAGKEEIRQFYHRAAEPPAERAEKKCF